MQAIHDYTITATAWRYDEGYVPVLEVRGRDTTGTSYSGNELLTQAGYYRLRSDAINAAKRTTVKTVVLDGSTLRIRV